MSEPTNDLTWRQKYIQGRVDRGICVQCGQSSRPGKRLCQPCADISTKISVDWARRNSDTVNARKRPWQRKRNQELKAIVVTHYGGKCACCSERNIWFLTIDHKNSDATNDPRTRGPAGWRMTGMGWYNRLIRLGFPEDFQILCWNCNHAKEMYGNGIACPGGHAATS